MLFIHDDLMPMILIKEVRGNQKILLLWDPKLKQNENSTTSQPPYLITGISGFCHVPLFLFLALLIYYLQTEVHLLSKVCVLLILHMVYTICHTPWVINRLFPPQLDLVCCCFEEEYTYSYSILNHSSHLMAWLKGFSYQTINGNAYIQIHSMDGVNDIEIFIQYVLEMYSYLVMELDFCLSTQTIKWNWSTCPVDK